jgi:DNA polymerase (family X)
MSLNDEVAGLLSRMAAMMDLKGESPFKAIAFSRASRAVESMAQDIGKAVEDGSLAKVEGIGPSTRRMIEQYVRLGHSTDYDEVASTLPPGLLPMLEIPGLGPKTVALLWRERNIESVEGLSEAIAGGRLAGIKGIGDKKIEQIRQGIELRAAAGKRVGLPEAAEVVEGLLAVVRAIPQVLQAEAAGSFRRGRETVGDVDIVACLRDGEEGAGERVTAGFVAAMGVEKVLGQGATKASVLMARTAGGSIQADLRIVPRMSFGSALQYFTGSKDHNVKLRGLAQEKGLTLNEWGLYRQSDYDKAEKKTGQPPAAKAVAGETEAGVYEALGLAYIEPTLREGRDEIALAAANELPVLVKLGDIKADLHTHTTASDGVNTIVQMAEAARDLGYHTLAITDHSKTQAIANGLDEKRLLKHIEEIHQAASRVKGITLWAGSEVDILADGTLDYSDDILSQLDWVVASPHVSLRQEPAKATERLLRAIDNKYVNVIGHPSGRLIGLREGLSPDWEELFKAAAKAGVAMEINASWPRLDLNDVHARAALSAGGLLSINTDAHSTGGLSERRWGLLVAQRAGATVEQVINCWPAGKLAKWAKHRR